MSYDEYRGRGVVAVFGDGTSKVFANKSQVHRQLSIPYAVIKRLLATGEAYHQKRISGRKKEDMTIDYVLTKEEVG